MRLIPRGTVVKRGADVDYIGIWTLTKLEEAKGSARASESVTHFRKGRMTHVECALRIDVHDRFETFRR